MFATEGSVGRVFILRLEDGDEIAPCIEKFARDHGIQTGYVSFIGGATGGEISIGARSSAARPVDPAVQKVEGACDAAACGLLAPGNDGQPVLQLHGSFGREAAALTGGVRPQVKTWVTGEAILYEILGANCRRVPDSASGLAFLQPAEAEAAARVQPTHETVAVKRISDQNASILHLFNAWVN